MHKTLRLWGAAAVVFWMSAGAAHAQAYVNATVGGELAPGVYGRIQIGNAPPPPLLYPQPVIIHQPAVVVPRSPIYLYVPPGHAKNWGKHCARYNACNQPVYFVKEPPRRAPPGAHGWGPEPRRDDGRGYGKRNEPRYDNRSDDGPGNGRGQGRGNKHRD
ncbi:MAG TPA: hypothetical protein DET46_16115 [Comamonadaceae bacterium]|nr:MAG: hypothetical protein A3F76_08415 [Burkholderiales bacterium RIFCSPLOWO2_12_FULL_65_40]HCE30013.1 hypothetical protein [Comamonadaceae bacterium]